MAYWRTTGEDPFSGPKLRHDSEEGPDFEARFGPRGRRTPHPSSHRASAGPADNLPRRRGEPYGGREGKHDVYQENGTVEFTVEECPVWTAPTRTRGGNSHLEEMGEWAPVRSTNMPCPVLVSINIFVHRRGGTCCCGRGTQHHHKSMSRSLAPPL
jgi:hypothetical protein